MAARVDCPRTVAPGPYMPASFTGQAMTLTAADVTNFNSFKPTGNDLLIVYGGAAGGTYTLQSSADPQQRTGDFTTIAIAALAIHVYAFKNLLGWIQSDNTIWIKGSVATILFGVAQLPG